MKIKYPISLKQILLFSFLIILFLGVSTTLVSTLIRSDDRIKAEESNLALNGRTAQTIESSFENIQNNSYVFFEAFSAVQEDVQKKELSDAFFRSNQDILFVFSPETDLLVNPEADSAEADIQAFINSSDALAVTADTSATEKTVFFNASAVFDIPAVIFIYKYGPKNAVKNAFVGCDVASLCELMGSGSNNTTVVID